MDQTEMLKKHQWAGTAHGMYGTARRCSECHGMCPDDRLNLGCGEYKQGKGHTEECELNCLINLPEIDVEQLKAGDSIARFVWRWLIHGAKIKKRSFGCLHAKSYSQNYGRLWNQEAVNSWTHHSLHIRKDILERLQKIADSTGAGDINTVIGRSIAVYETLIASGPGEVFIQYPAGVMRRVNLKPGPVLPETLQEESEKA